MDGVQIVIKAQGASTDIAAHVTRAKELLADIDCRMHSEMHSEDKTLMQVYELRQRLRATRKELAAASRPIHRTIWPKASASDAYVRWRSDQLSAGLIEE
jgi:hypothetical protein